jgi:hypothetical protein
MARVKPFAFLSLVPALLALAPLSVSAQGATPPITPPLEVEYAGESQNGKARLIITAQQCDQASGGELHFSAKYPVPAPVLEGWIGKGSNDCTRVESRTRVSANQQVPVCRRVFLAEESTAELSFALHPHDLFWTHDRAATRWPEATEQDAGTDDAGGTTVGRGPGCDLISNQLYTLYILPLNQATDLLANIAFPVTSGISTLQASFSLYSKRPAAPTGLVGEDGKSQLALTFASVPGAFPQTRYRAYFDWGTGAGACGSGALQAGESAPAESPSLASVEAVVDQAQLGAAKLAGLDAKGIEIGDAVAVSVISVDPAGSESLLAAPICLTRGVTDQPAEPAPKCEDEGLVCSLQPGARESGVWGFGLLLGVAAFGFVVRRRR